MADAAATAAAPLDDEWDDAPMHKAAALPEAELDITPMIDVTFLLLIFFIVCSVIDQQTPIDLPGARNGLAVGERECYVITVKEGGVDHAPVFLEEEPSVALTDDMEKQAELIRAGVEKAKAGDANKDPKQDVLIKADRNVAHREVARVIKAVSKVTDMRIHLAVTETK